MHNTDWGKVNTLMLSAFKHYDAIEPKYTRDTRSELLGKLQDMRVPLLDILIVVSNSRTVKIQNNSRPEMKTFLSGDDKAVLEKMLIDKIEGLQLAGILEDGWSENPVKAKRDLMSYIKSVTIERKEVKGRVYLGLYDSIPWPDNYKETDKCILIYRLGLLLGVILKMRRIFTS